VLKPCPKGRQLNMLIFILSWPRTRKNSIHRFLNTCCNEHTNFKKFYMIVELYILTYAHGHQQINVMLNSDEFLIMSLLILFFQNWNILETSLKGYNACSYYMLDNVNSTNVSYEYSNLVKSQTWSSPKTHDPSNATFEMCSLKVAIGSIGFDVWLESEGSDTYHLLSWFHVPNMCSTNKTLNLLKILRREVEFYLSKKSMGIQNLEPTYKSWFMSTTM
jgi:hypothetical protein